MPASTGTDAIFDAALDYIISNVTHIVPLDAEPTAGFSDVDTPASSGGQQLAKRAFSGSLLSKQSDGSGGRELAVPTYGYLALESGDVDHIALIDDGASTILVYYEHDDGNGNAVSVTADQAFNINAHTVGIQNFQSA